MGVVDFVLNGGAGGFAGDQHAEVFVEDQVVDVGGASANPEKVGVRERLVEVLDHDGREPGVFAVLDSEDGSLVFENAKRVFVFAEVLKLGFFVDLNCTLVVGFENRLLGDAVNVALANLKSETAGRLSVFYFFTVSRGSKYRVFGHESAFT